jgi:hypothetical protein
VESGIERIHSEIKLSSSLKHLDFNSNAFLFNSWENTPISPKQKAHSRLLTVFGSDIGDMEWVKHDAGVTGSFSCRTNGNATPDPLASSGGYITFYADPRDRMGMQSIRFRCKGTSKQDAVDFGVRIAVDDPRGAGDRELATYQFNSVASMGPVTGDWRTLEIPIKNFKMTTLRPPFPRGLDANTINKVVFFLNYSHIKNSSDVTIFLSDITLVPLSP